MRKRAQVHSQDNTATKITYKEMAYTYIAESHIKTCKYIYVYKTKCLYNQVYFTYFMHSSF